MLYYYPIARQPLLLLACLVQKNGLSWPLSAPGFHRDVVRLTIGAFSFIERCLGKQAIVSRKNRAQQAKKAHRGKPAPQQADLELTPESNALVPAAALKRATATELKPADLHVL